AAQADIFDGELDRRQRGVLTDLRRSQLVHRDADTNGISLWAGSGEEDRSRARVLGSGIGALRAGVSEIRHDTRLGAVFFEWSKTLGELKISSFRRRRPLIHRRAMWDINAAEPRLWTGGGIF